MPLILRMLYPSRHLQLLHRVIPVGRRIQVPSSRSQDVCQQLGLTLILWNEVVVQVLAGLVV